MNAISFWKYFLWGAGIISLCYCGLFIYNYIELGGGTAWQSEDGRVPIVVMAGIISMSWCCTLFFWIYCALTDAIKKFVLSALPAFLAIVAISTIAHHLLR